MKNYMASDATLIRRAGSVERLAKSLHNVARQGVTTSEDREEVLSLLYRIQSIVTKTIQGE